jgi:pimeloyl-ACP methyl ester carboxylesterase
MNTIDLGTGPPVVLIPGIQGRWEWMKRAVDALSTRCRVLTFSLADEPSSGASWDRTDGFERYVAQVLEAMDEAGVESAAICGVSYGGLIAARFAAVHPEKTSALILVSALPPGWQPDARVRVYVSAPRLMLPAFVAGSLRLFPEIVAARGSLATGAAAAARHALNVLAHMFSPTRMARRITLLQQGIRIGRLEMPTLIVTGEDGLDRVVPPARTREYQTCCPHAEIVVMPRTGHLGLVTRPDEFARIVGGFVERTAHRDVRRRIG